MNPFEPDWLKVARLPWVTLAAMRGGEFSSFWHFGHVLRFWIGFEEGRLRYHRVVR